MSERLIVIDAAEIQALQAAVKQLSATIQELHQLKADLLTKLEDQEKEDTPEWVGKQKALKVFNNYELGEKSFKQAVEAGLIEYKIINGNNWKVYKFEHIINYPHRVEAHIKRNA